MRNGDCSGTRVGANEALELVGGPCQTLQRAAADQTGVELHPWSGIKTWGDLGNVFVRGL